MWWEMAPPNRSSTAYFPYFRASLRTSRLWLTTCVSLMFRSEIGPILMCIYIYIQYYIYIYITVYYIFVSYNVYTHCNVYIYMHVCMYTYVHTHTHIYIYLYSNICGRNLDIPCIHVWCREGRSLSLRLLPWGLSPGRTPSKTQNWWQVFLVSSGWFQMGLSENRVYSQWNSHLIGIMISKTIGFRGTLFSDKPKWMLVTMALLWLISVSRWSQKAPIAQPWDPATWQWKTGHIQIY